MGSSEIINFFNDILYFVDTNYLYFRFALTVGIALVIFLGIHPLKTKSESTTSEFYSVVLRRMSLIFVFIVTPIFLVFLYLITLKIYGNTDYFTWFFTNTIYGFAGSIPLYAALIAGTFTFKIIALRIIAPNWSKMIRKYRVRQSSTKMSDIRAEIENMKTKTYSTLDYLKDEHMFIGLDEKNNPLYVSDEEFKSMHSKLVGPTQVGKGVIQGVLIYQSIIKGWTTGFFDIKPDKYIYSIMCKACKDAGRPPPIVVDLNGVGPGSYNMFTNGTDREIMNRLQTALNINENGTNADFYSAEERALLMDIYKYFDGSLASLERLLLGKLPNGEKRPEYYDMTKKSRAYVKEMKSHKPINPPRGKGFNVDRSIKEGAVFYIKGSITDKLVKKAQTVLLMDIIQSAIRIGDINRHFYLAIDEVKFIVSDMLSTGLSTVLSSNMNMSVAFQTPDNLLNLEDSKLNAKAIKSEIEVNTLMTLCYRAQDDDVADWAAKQSGTRNKITLRSEDIDYDQMGAEKYTGRKQTQREQEEFMPKNRLLALPPRTGVLMRPNHLAKVVYTCWIPLEPSEMKRIEKKSKNTNTVDQNNKPTKKQKTVVDDLATNGELITDEDFSDIDIDGYSAEDFIKEAGIDIKKTAT